MIVLPCMASIISKLKGNKLYYYVVESARVDGKPRIVNQAYLGSAEKVAALVKDRCAPVPLSAFSRDFGLPGALWLAAVQTGVFDLLLSLWPTPRSGPSPAHYLLLAAIHRVCRPGPKTTVADWYDRSILRSLWDLPPERFSSQAFWDAFEQIWPESLDPLVDQDPLELAQSRLLGVWKQKQKVSQRLLAYDTTNFHTYFASTNSRSKLAQRGHNKQGHHNLRQVGLSYVLDAVHGLSLCHHVYPGNVGDVDELDPALQHITALLDHNQIPRDTVTLVFDKGSAALANTVTLEKSGVGWISALPWNQAPASLRDRPTEQLSLCTSQQPGVRAAAETLLVHGKQYLCVLKYSSSFATEQLHSLTTTLAKAMQGLRRLSMELGKPKPRWKPEQVRNKVKKLLTAQFLEDLILFTIEERNGTCQLQFDIDNAALQRLLTHRLGRTVLLTNRMDWSAEQVVAGYSAQQGVEQVFRGLKGGDWLNWGPLFHWTDRKIRIHAFYCLLGISLLQYIHRQAQSAWAGISVEQLLDELRHVQQFTLLYPPQGDKGPPRVATVLAKQTLTQQSLCTALGLDQLHTTP